MDSNLFDGFIKKNSAHVQSVEERQKLIERNTRKEEVIYDNPMTLILVNKNEGEYLIYGKI